MPVSSVDIAPTPISSQLMILLMTSFSSDLITDLLNSAYRHARFGHTMRLLLHIRVYHTIVNTSRHLTIGSVSSI